MNIILSFSPDRRIRQTKAESGKRSVLTLGSLCLPCYMRETVRIQFIIFFTSEQHVTSSLIDRNLSHPPAGAIPFYLSVILISIADYIVNGNRVCRQMGFLHRKCDQLLLYKFKHPYSLVVNLYAIQGRIQIRFKTYITFKQIFPIHV